MEHDKDHIIAVVGLGYVGLPLAVEFGKRFRTVGYDLSEAKVQAYHRYEDIDQAVIRRCGGRCQGDVR